MQQGKNVIIEERALALTLSLACVHVWERVFRVCCGGRWVIHYAV